MKSATEKIFALIATAAALFAAAGCAPVTPRDRVAGALDADGELYLVTESAALFREGSLGLADIERRVAESESPQRDTIQSYLTALRMLCRFSGAGSVEVVGLSSRREADGSCLNRCAVAGNPASQWPWNLGGAPGDRLLDLCQLPGDTVAAASFTVDAAAAAAELRREGAEKLLEYKNPLLLGLSVGEALDHLSGWWRLTILPPPLAADGAPDWSQCGFHLSLPDREGTLFRRLAALLPPDRDGMLHLPANGNVAPVVTGGDGRIDLYSTPECRSRIASPGRTLGDEPGFAAAAAKLPRRVSGAFYFTDDGPGVGVWTFHPGMVELSAYSTRGTATQALRRLFLTPLALVVDQELARRPAAETQPAPPVRRPALPAPEQMKKRRAALAGAMAHMKAARESSGQFPPELPEKFSGLVWFGAPENGGSGKLPLIVEVPDRKRPGIGVLFADGTIEFFAYPAASLKHLCSFLHTRYHYEEKEFARLIRRASELDAKKKGSRP